MGAGLVRPTPMARPPRPGEPFDVAVLRRAHVLARVARQGAALFFAREADRADRDVVLRAVASDGHALC